jgi:hypothetical protein
MDSLLKLDSFVFIRAVMIRALLFGLATGGVSSHKEVADLLRQHGGHE